jgi:hypothetical protein
MSANKLSLAAFIGSIVAVVLGLIVLFAPQPAVAQCQDPQPSCCACHTTAHPVADEGEWHTIHARKECCRACHGGNDRADDEDLAHSGMTLHPLQDTYLACHQCHPDDYQQRAQVFAVALQITPVSHEPTPRSNVPAATPPSIVTPAAQPAASAAVVWDWPTVLAITVLVAGIGALGWWRSHAS